LAGWLRRVTAVGRARRDAVLVALLVVAALPACEQPGAAPVVPISPLRLTATPILPTATAVPATVTPDLAATATMVAFQEFKAGYPPGWLNNPIHAASATEAAQNAATYRTATALTPMITQPPWTPEPTPTLGLRLITDLNCWSAVHPGAALFDSCWETDISGTRIHVGAGYRGESLDHSLQGLLWVCPEPCIFPSPDQLYTAPRADLHIIAVNGVLVTLASRDPSIRDSFVFDLATDQWVSLTPGPAPAPGVSPLPSATP
jgi:hypothetical protein